MNATIAGALIGALATIAAAVYTVRAMRKKPKLDPPDRRERDFLTGHWIGYWRIVHPPARVEKEFGDSIDISVTADGRVTGRGTNPAYGDYVIEGRAWHYALTMQYKGAPEDDERVGVVLLEKDVMNRTMTGEWSQLASGKVIIRGEVRWEKANH